MSGFLPDELFDLLGLLFPLAFLLLVLLSVDSLSLSVLLALAFLLSLAGVLDALPEPAFFFFFFRFT